MASVLLLLLIATSALSDGIIVAPPSSLCFILVIQSLVHYETCIL